MKFDDAGKVEMVVWDMRQADQGRANDRAVLQRLYNGHPPYDEAEAERNGVQINVNWLEGTNILTQARGQWNNAFLKPQYFFTVALDSGPAEKRREWSEIITQEINRRLKRNPRYLETIRATGANVVLHGVGPKNWPDRTCTTPIPVAVSSLLIPSDTDISFDNLDHFAIFREWTPAQLYRMTHGPKVDPGWDMQFVKQQLVRAAEEQRKSQNTSAYQYQPEKIEELIKQDGGYWGSDAVPTIDVWDFYFREEEDGDGWYRRVILDSGLDSPNPDGVMNKNGRFLYNSKGRKYADTLSQIMQCSYGDCSAVAPFKYHSVRSLGWMLWGPCDVANRLRCKFTESAFEQCMWFFRADNPGQFERIKKAVFTHMGAIPSGITWVPGNERFKPDPSMIQLAMGQMRQLMGENSASFTQDYQQGTKQTEMTATETMVRVNAANALVSNMFLLAYNYQAFEYIEVARRFCLKNSQDKDAKAFRLACMKRGVPEDYLDHDRWIVEPEKVMGGGNKTLEIAQANQLMQLYPLLAPQAQQKALHIAVGAFTSDPQLTNDLVPSDQKLTVSNSVHDAQLAASTLMQGLPVGMTDGMNHIEYVETLLQSMAAVVQTIQATGGMATKEQVIGLANMATNIGQHIAVIAQNPEEKPRVKRYQDALTALTNMLKGYAQRIAEQQQAGGGQPQVDPEVIGKIQSQQILAEAKAANLRESHAQRTAQKQVSFEMEEQRKERQKQADLRRQGVETGASIAAEDSKTAAEITRQGIRERFQQTEQQTTTPPANE